MITSLANKKIVELNKLKQKKHRLSKGMFLVEGHNLVEEASKSGYLLEVLSVQETSYPNTTLVSSHILEKLSSTKSPQGIIGICKLVNNVEIGNKVLVLDINDPGNLGTLLRSALGFGFKTVYLTKESVDEYNPKVLRASQGAIFGLSIKRMELDDIVNNLEGYRFISAHMNGDENIEIKDESIALFLGHETHGVKQEILDISETISIHTEEIESLNVGVAGSIIMYQLRS